MLEFKTSFTNSKSLKVFLLNTICFHSFSYGSSFYIKTTFVVKLLLLNMNFHSFHLCFIVSCCFCNKLVFCETPIRVKFISWIYERLCVIWYHLYNLRNVKNTHGEVLRLEKLEANACNFTKSSTLLWVLFMFFTKFLPNGTKSRKTSHIISV